MVTATESATQEQTETENSKTQNYKFHYHRNFNVDICSTGLQGPSDFRWPFKLYNLKMPQYLNVLRV